MNASFRDRIYASYYRGTYASVNPASDEAYHMHARILRQLLVPHLPVRRDAEVIDVACGIGYAVHALRDAGYERVHGIDWSQEQVEVARSRGLPVERADLFEVLGARREAYDAVVALDILEHLDRDELLRMFDLTRESLRPGGRLIAKTANANSPLASRFRYLDFTHEIIFTERSLRAALLAAGLTPVWIGGERYTPFTAGGWIRRVAAGAARSLWRAYLVAELGREGLGVPLEFALIAVAERP